MGSARAVGASWLVVLALAGTTRANPWLPPPLGSAPFHGSYDHARRSFGASSRDGAGRLHAMGFGPPRTLGSAAATIATPGSPAAAKKKFPRSLARRGLLLPLGVVQGSAMFALETVNVDSGARNRGFIDPRVRIGIGAGELELAGSFLAYRPPSMTMGPGAPERFLTAAATAKLNILPNTAIGAELAVRNPVADARIYAPRAVAATRIRPTVTSAIEVTLKTGVDTIGEGDRKYVTSGELRLQAQATAEIAVEARGLVALTRSSFAQTYGIRIVGGVSPELDVIAGFDLTAIRDTETVKMFSLGFAARRLP